MKKTLAIILTLVLIFCMMPMHVFAAKENFIKISEVTVNEIPSPAAETEVQFSANCTTKYVAINTIKWYEKKTEAASGTALSNGAKFKPGYYYTVSVELKISNNAYYFAGNGSGVAATVNGKTAKVVTNNSAQVITVEYTFPMCLTTVSVFEFNLADPVANAAPHYPLLTGIGYESNNRGNNGAAYKNGIYWRNETDNKVLYPDENPKFEAGKTYSADITVATTTGYRVASSYTVKVNGKTVNSQKVDNECITFKVEFKVPKAHIHTSSDWKSDAANHWKVCTDTACGAVTVTNEAHKDADKDNKCDTCGFALPKADTPASSKPTASKPNASKPDATKPDASNTDKDTAQTSKPTDSKPDASVDDGSVTIGAETESSVPENTDTSETQKPNDNNSNAWIWIVLVIIVLAAAGVVTFVVIKKKKSK